MRHSPVFALIFTAVVGLGHASFAQDAPKSDDGFSLMEEGAKLLFKGLMSEMEPAISGMSDALKDMEPAIKDLVALIDDFRNYEAPKILDNGDILIPRRPGAPPAKLKPTPDPAPSDSAEQIDL